MATKIKKLSFVSADVLFIDVLGDLDFVLTGLILKASSPFAKEKDLTHSLIFF